MSRYVHSHETINFRRLQKRRRNAPCGLIAAKAVAIVEALCDDVTVNLCSDAVALFGNNRNATR
jgi:hypothetical protein